MGIFIESKGRRIEIDPGKALDWLAAQAIGMIQRRASKGIALDGSKMKPYSLSYLRQLVRMGEGTNVDLTVSGAMLADFREVARKIDGAYASVTIGPGTGTSERRRPPHSDEHIERLNEAGIKAKKERPHKPRAVKTGERSPPHNVLAGMIHRGTPRMPARPFVGLTADEQKRLIDGLVRRVLKAANGPA